MFEYEGLPPPCCPRCKKLRDEQFHIVRDVVRECPGITALQVHQVTEISMDIILHFVENGMIEVIPTTNKDGKLDERIGLMIEKAKELREQYKQHKEEDTPKLDELSTEELKEKFTWHKI